jgi:Flp pilus assembly protein TadD
MDNEAWKKRGIALSLAGRYQEALGAFTKAIEINPNDADAWMRKVED